MSGALSRSTPTQTKILTLVVALAVFAAGSAVPLPGVVSSWFRAPGLTLSSSRLSIFGLGVTPLVGAVVLVEILRLIAPPFARWSVAPENAFRFQTGVWILGLAAAAMQAYGVARALGGMRSEVVDPDSPYVLVTIVTMVGATAFLGWLAQRVTLAGAGDGLLIFFAAPALQRFIADAEPTFEGMRRAGVALPTHEFVIEGVAVAALVGGALASRPQPRAALGFGGGTLDPIPPLIAASVAVIFAFLFSRYVMRPSGPDMWATRTIVLSVIAGLIALCGVMRSALPGADAPRPIPWPATLATILVCCGLQLAAEWPTSKFLINGFRLVPIVAAALSIVDAFGLRERLRARPAEAR